MECLETALGIAYALICVGCVIALVYAVVMQVLEDRKPKR